MSNPTGHERWSRGMFDLLSEQYLDIFGDQFFRPMHIGVKSTGSKLVMADKYRQLDKYRTLKQRLESRDSWSHVFADNGLRLTALALIDRLVTVRQTSLFSASSVLSGKDNAASAFNSMRS